ncbi:signal peptide protein [Rhodopirellula europaea SH398]|uniref:Signal peptide protein n=1 Tax=Rhodopirellula europaea SH398 TaxID=1263868 RepID=M5SIX0_9BACT|nr:signal peptide protein [Rhodopirellula europaea SH398]
MHWGWSPKVKSAGESALLISLVSCEFILSRSLIGSIAALVFAVPASAHPGHGSTEGLTHYAAEPAHVVPMLASFAASGLLLAAGWFAMGRLNQSQTGTAAQPIRVEDQSPRRASRTR